MARRVAALSTVPQILSALRTIARDCMAKGIVNTRDGLDVSAMRLAVDALKTLLSYEQWKVVTATKDKIMEEVYTTKDRADDPGYRTALYKMARIIVEKGDALEANDQIH